MKRKEDKPLYEQQMQPHDTDTEKAVLATLIRYNNKYLEYSDILSSDMFYYEKDKAIFRCVRGVLEDGGITDINTLHEYSQRNEVGFSLERLDFVDILQNSSVPALGQNIRWLREMGRRRRAWVMLQQASQKVFDLTVDFDEELNGILSSVGEMQTELGDEDISDFGGAMDEVRATVDNNGKGFTQSLITGFRIFDDHYLLRPQTLTIIAAFPAVGKSALSLNIAMAVAKNGIPSAYYSLEMGKMELASRAISKDLDMPSYAILNKPMDAAKREILEKVIGEKRNYPIYFDDRSTVSFDRVMRSIRTLVKTKGIRLAIIDYLQIFNQMSDDEEKGLGMMARACKNIAKETNIAVIALSQLNRSGKHPSLRMMRGSGQIEESADNVVLIDRPEAYPDNDVTKYEGDFSDCSIHNTAKLILSKGRGVGVGSSLVAFNGKFTRFSDIVKPDDNGYYEHDEGMPF